MFGVGGAFPSGDVVSTSYLPFAILLRRTFALGGVLKVSRNALPYYLKYSTGHVVSAYPVVTAILALPFYAPYVLLGGAITPLAAAYLGKLSATGMTITAVLIFDRALHDYPFKSVWTKYWALIVFALGTETFAISSQGLWQHTAGELLICCMLFLIVRSERVPDGLSNGQAVALGALAGLLVWTRPIDGLIGAPLLVWAWTRRRPVRTFLWTALGALGPLALMGLYDYVAFGAVTTLGGYGGPSHVLGYFRFPLLLGLMGNLVSPSKGWLVYDPWLLILICQAVPKWRIRSLHGLHLAFLAGTGATLLCLAKFFQWPGGWVFGPRYMTDLSPVLVFYSASVLDVVLSTPRRWGWRRTLQVIATLAGVWSIGIYALGAYVPNVGTWVTGAGPDTFWRGLWTVGGSQPAYAFNSWIYTMKPLIPIKEPNVSINDLALLDKPYIWRPGIPVRRLVPGAIYHGVAKVTNYGTQTLPAFPDRTGIGVVRFSYHVLQGGKVVTFDGVRSVLLQSLPPGRSEEVYFRFLAPSAPGRYVVAFTLVQEGVQWFQSGGAATNAYRLSIIVA